MSMIALRIPDSLRKEMKRVKINWSEYLRSSIYEALESSEKKRFIQKAHRLTSSHQNVKPGTSAGIIRQIRENA